MEKELTADEQADVIRQAIKTLHIDTPYYTAHIDREAACVVITLYGGEVRQLPLPAAAPRRKSSRRGHQT